MSRRNRWGGNGGQKRPRFALRVKKRGEWHNCSVRFDPDTYETAHSYGEAGIDDELIEAFEVIERTI